MTRDKWLMRVASGLSPTFTRAGRPLPSSYRISIGFPSSGRRGVRIGECWSREQSKDKHFEIFIRPDLEDPLKVAAVVAHELVHAAVGIKAGHGKAFRLLAVAIGLEGPMRTTKPGEKFKRIVEPILERLGPIPHATLAFRTAAMVAADAAPRQLGRQLKAGCKKCGYIVRTSRMWLDKMGPPLCPLHGLMSVGVKPLKKGDQLKLSGTY